MILVETLNRQELKKSWNLNFHQLSDPGYGPPVDALDMACKRHKDCLSFGWKFDIIKKKKDYLTNCILKKIFVRVFFIKFKNWTDLRCAKNTHGDMCVKEFVKYDFGSKSKGLCSANSKDQGFLYKLFKLK